jgi:hypothetical protein
MFDIHVTVKNQFFSDEKFVSDCHKIGVKPLIFELYHRDGTRELDYMTVSEQPYLNYAINYCFAAAADLTKLDYTVIRHKVEGDPRFHSWVPQDKIEQPYPGVNNYLETHFTIETGRIDELFNSDVVVKQGLHLSRDCLKPNKIILTLRDYQNGFKPFSAISSIVAEELTAAGWKIKKKVTEYAIYDDNAKHDRY